MLNVYLDKVGGVISVKDPTRGGLADALNEWTEKSKVGILIQEDKVPIRKDVQAACDMLGLTPWKLETRANTSSELLQKKRGSLGIFEANRRGQKRANNRRSHVRIQRRSNANCRLVAKE